MGFHVSLGECIYTVIIPGKHPNSSIRTMNGNRRNSSNNSSNRCNGKEEGSYNSGSQSNDDHDYDDHGAGM